GVDLLDATEVGHGARRHVRPCLAAIPCAVDQTIVRSGPDDVRVTLRGADREDHRIYFRAVHVAGDRTARVAHRLRVVTREVAGDRRPALAAVRRLPETLRSRVLHVGID